MDSKLYRKQPKKKHNSKRSSGFNTYKHSDEDVIKINKDVEHVLGLTIHSNSALTSDPTTGAIAYPAGSVLVVLDAVLYKQVGTLHAPRRTITAVKFSPDGQYILTGESGLKPAARVWDVSSMTEIATLQAHNVGITAVSFSPRMQEVIVVGDSNDMVISVWSWPAAILKGLNKFTGQILAMAVSEDSRFFVTVGHKHVKFFYTDFTYCASGSVCQVPVPVPFPSRCGILDDLMENSFCDVVCGRGQSSHYIYIISTEGILCQVNRNRLLERWVHVNASSAHCITADEYHLFVGCDAGVIRMFRNSDLQFLETLPLPHSLSLDTTQIKLKSPGTTDKESVLGIGSGEQQKDNETEKEQHAKKQGKKYPSVKALTYNHIHKLLIVVYNDHSLYVWAEKHYPKIKFKKNYSSVYHRGSVWDFSTFPETSSSFCEKKQKGVETPAGAIVTVSADGTMRTWDMSQNFSNGTPKSGCVSANCLKIVHADRGELSKARQKCNNTLHANHRGKVCFSVLAMCPDGEDITTGNRQGSLYVYNTGSMKVCKQINAHSAEVTALAYCKSKNWKLLASGGRDRMIHVMDAGRDYQLLTSLDDHSSTITAIHFTQAADCLLMISSSVDMSVLVRAYLQSKQFSFKPLRAIVEKKSVLDFAIHPWSGLMAIACQDRLVHIYSIVNADHSHTFTGCPKYGGQVTKIRIDPSGHYLLTACSNKTINLLKFSTGCLITTFNGHAETITCIRFAHNMKHVISAATDGCILLWRTPQLVEYTVKREMAEMGILTPGMVQGDRWKKSQIIEEKDETTTTESINGKKVPEKQTEKVHEEDFDSQSPNIIRAMSDSPPKESDSKPVSSESGAWLSTCYERRRIFKLEAKSIKKMLTLMRLVTDAMEKDLATDNANLSRKSPVLTGEITLPFEDKSYAEKLASMSIIVDPEVNQAVTPPTVAELNHENLKTENGLHIDSNQSSTTKITAVDYKPIYKSKSVPLQKNTQLHYNNSRQENRDAVNNTKVQNTEVKVESKNFWRNRRRPASAPSSQLANFQPQEKYRDVEQPNSQTECFNTTTLEMQKRPSKTETRQSLSHPLKEPDVCDTKSKSKSAFVKQRGSKEFLDEVKSTSKDKENFKKRYLNALQSKQFYGNTPRSRSTSLSKGRTSHYRRVHNNTTGTSNRDYNAA